MSNSIAANDIIQNIDDLLAEYPVDECINILQEVVKQIDVRIKDLVNIHNKSEKNQMKTLTVGELIEKLKKMPKSANVFMLTDRTESNWDEENAKFIRVHGVEYVEKETVYPNDGYTDKIETNVLLQIEEDEI